MPMIPVPTNPSVPGSGACTKSLGKYPPVSELKEKDIHPLAYPPTSIVCPVSGFIPVAPKLICTGTEKNALPSVGKVKDDMKSVELSAGKKKSIGVPSIHATLS